MLDRDLLQDLDAYLDENWEGMLADLQRLVRIESVQDMDAAGPGAPYGPGPARALEEALALWASYGFDVRNCEGHVGYADLPGTRSGQVGIIGHVDVVPIGQGWHFDPLSVTRKDGYLIGRGVSDDKGPLLMALHAARFWMLRGEAFGPTLRFIIGNNEETGMRDLDYYRARFEDPDMLFSPDDEFPVCYGEMGVLQGVLTSAPIPDGLIEEWQGGMACNAVPGSMRVKLRVGREQVPPARDIAVEPADDGCCVVTATGLQAHASTPGLGKSAIKIMVDYLLRNGLYGKGERNWLELVDEVVRSHTGSGMGLAGTCPHFGALTMVGGLAGKQDRVFTQTVDIRFGTDTSAGFLESVLARRAERYGASFESTHVMEPFLMNPAGPLVSTLLESYRDVTGDMQDAFTIGGATYARHFKAGVGFGADVHGRQRPAWVGGMHAADEGVAESCLQDAFKVYAVAIRRLMDLC